ncbi:TlpA family protein disulfide reductase [Robertkochia solimangrovi]|uniref:TlpA family protein disulfide reductase n=1 Tax=Robertkochia solimangrovi TaxID=2213046 RepID=UPI00117F8402|nr:TlpA disulfide reductase family protein [Robertkochia solimangrovi]TRZ41634.1 hypothetical protein DMZ48_16635 [Robertkochia solimangrovi]
MKRLTLLLNCLILTLLFSCEENHQSTRFKIEFENYPYDSIQYGLSSLDDKGRIDFKYCSITDGIFMVDTVLNEPKEVILLPKTINFKLSDGTDFMIRSKQVKFFLFPNDRIQVKATLNEDMVDYTVFGNEINREMSAFRKQILEDYVKTSMAMFYIEDLFSKNGSDSLIDKHYEDYDLAAKRILESEKDYILQNPGSKFAAYLTYNIRGNDSISKYFNTLNEQGRRTAYGIVIEEKLNTWRSVTVGSKAPDISYKTLSGTTFDLNQNTERIIVLDFWGTWCAPCMGEMDNLKEVYLKYKDTVEIVGIACHDNYDTWSKTIESLDLDWTHILNDKEADDLSKKFAVEGYPTKIIIDQNGMIRGIYKAARNDRFYKDLENLVAGKI